MTIFKWGNALARVNVGLPVPPPTSTITLPPGIEAQSKPDKSTISALQRYKDVPTNPAGDFRENPTRL